MSSSCGRTRSRSTLLFRDLLIGVTGFFRDPGAFAALAEQVIPPLFEGRGAGRHAAGLGARLRHRGGSLFPGDAAARAYGRAARPCRACRSSPPISTRRRCSVARAGRYPAALLDGIIPAERLARFFTREGARYMVTKELRDLCVFSAHSLIRDPPFSRIDLISCRNLLIYLDGGLQDTVVPLFHYALRPGGFLFLGASENTPAAIAAVRRPGQGQPHLPPARQRGGGAAAPALPGRRRLAAAARPGRGRGRRPPAGAALRQAGGSAAAASNSPRPMSWSTGRARSFTSRPGLGKYLRARPPASRAANCWRWRGAACGSNCGRRCRRRWKPGAGRCGRGSRSRWMTGSSPSS